MCIADTSLEDTLIITTDTKVELLLVSIDETCVNIQQINHTVNYHMIQNFDGFGKLQNICQIFLFKIFPQKLINRKYVAFTCVKPSVNGITGVKI